MLLLSLLIINLTIWIISMINHIVTDYQKIKNDEFIEHQPFLRVVIPCIIAPILGLTYHLSVWCMPLVILLLWNINWLIADYYLNKLRNLDKNYIGTEAFMDKVLLKSPFKPLLTKFILGCLFTLSVTLIEYFK
jgi:hypothetical protein